MAEHACHNKSGTSKIDYLLTGSLTIIAVSLLVHFILPTDITPIYIEHFSDSVAELAGRMWWGVLIGVAFVGILSRTPKELVMSVLGNGDGISSILRATLAGVVLDLCSHGILMVGMKLYERGASLGQVMAFLIASPWNSLSLTFILISLIGLNWTLVFIALSLVIAIASGMLFNALVRNNTLPTNPNRSEQQEDIPFLPQLRTALSHISFSAEAWIDMLRTGVKESRIVLRWVFFGIVLASLVRIMLSPEVFSDWFGPTFVGLWLTLAAATVIEVCSEGATPIAADLLTRANAPGNSFAFLMAGVATDYTEIMAIKGTTKSWKIAFFLPLITLPQVILLSWLLNQFS